MSNEVINQFIQNKLLEMKMEKVKATEAATWLNQEGLLIDNPNRPGNALRKMLPTEITGAVKEKNLWYIHAQTPLKEKKKPAAAIQKEVKGKPVKSTKEKPVKQPKEKPKEKSAKTTKVKPAREAAAPEEKPKHQFDNLDSCYEAVKSEEELAKIISDNPLDLIANARDLTRVAIMRIAAEKIEDYSARASYEDTVTMLYSKRLIGKVTVQCLHLIRKLGNIALHEKEHFNQNSSPAVARMIAGALIIFYEEAKNNGLL